MDRTVITVGNASGAVRLDAYIAANSRFSRSYIKRLLEDGGVLLNGSAQKSGKTVKSGDVIEIAAPDPVLSVEPEDVPIDILYEDGALAVINKARGVTVHPGGGARSGTLVNGLMYYLDNLSSINGQIRPGIVHRLDKDTSGVMVVAKTDAAHLSLSKQIERRSVKKIYVGLCEGVIKDDGGTVKTFIARSPKNRKLMAVSSAGREAVTAFKVLERFTDFTFAEFDILTGRTHQIRVHAKHIGHPLVGDPAYGYKKQKFNVGGQLLHAKSLTFVHPVSGEAMTFTAPLPPDFTRVLDVLRKKGGRV
ncbi:MAG: RluA family pseudouridine synthase [Clostridiales bacterium]|jgi:23S rRNA pseudouridine1911/1915/1917 synthase|nr:RluA family pseudouridine synthase [Clostridiales bacterium]